ncbi:DUF3927 family protein [Dickeya dianthicola]|uniref:DUF3927 domain-containing protein n=1 Tax=Dickeya dianthicola TaxID=204039 RepID=A0AAX1C5I8_9GAMM|nr:DUF3927 family protein [Dickeya dianthicola]ATO31558.1 hypothetical protein DDI_0390 [Dickeya dianthicola RNS04.9]MCA7005029.1 DUF3927 family protein [Dickeya dianthicola]MCI4005078.1 DUF3927 family protein [Dickeya dianthicola]MCI4033130.1 DUF3927 family protein [Dickeya dianthicola]MCI4153978.1 DUF3927 family protein [Dickeya dianthicola]
MDGLTNKLRLAAAMVLAFMAVAVDFSSYLLSVASDAFFIGAMVAVIWAPLTKKA